MSEFGDTGDAYCAGDPTLDEIDWVKVTVLDVKQKAVLGLPEDRRPMAALALLDEMYEHAVVIL